MLGFLVWAFVTSLDFRANVSLALTGGSVTEEVAKERLALITSTSDLRNQYLPCEVTPKLEWPENNTRFQPDPASSWRCRQEVSSTYWLTVLDFQIKECPPGYQASTFQIEGSTRRSRIMGKISDRYIFRDGCGLYNVTVSLMDRPDSAGLFDVNLFWTSGFKHYSNRLRDIKEGHDIKMQELNTTQIEAMIAPERLEYLKRHMEPIFQKQVQINVQKPNLRTEQKQLPDCGTLPMEDWEPAGVFDDPTYNDTSPFLVPGSPHQWPFRPARCQFLARTLPEMNQLMAGLRVFTLGDSHGGNMDHEVRGTLCPELKDIAKMGTYYQHDYDCPNRTNSFAFAYRFFRGIFAPDMEHDFDAISANFRRGMEQSCEHILGLGLHNATIMLVPHWLFVYETQEGLDDFLLAIKSLVTICRETHSELMKDHIILLQSPTARDYLPFVDSNPLDLNPAHSWRGIHNHRMESFTDKMKTMLQGYIDGVIPAFEVTLARMKTDKTIDGVHLGTDSYRELFHMQISAIHSVMKFKRGIELPMMAADDPKARWFAGLSHQHPPFNL